MGAKKSYSFEKIAAPVPENWAERNFLLTIPELMTITRRSYYGILDLVKAKVLRPSTAERPYKFAPKEVMRVFFASKDSATTRTKAPRLTKEKNQAGEVPKPEKVDLWRR